MRPAAICGIIGCFIASAAFAGPFGEEQRFELPVHKPLQFSAREPLYSPDGLTGLVWHLDEWWGFYLDEDQATWRLAGRSDIGWFDYNAAGWVFQRGSWYLKVREDNGTSIGVVDGKLVNKVLQEPALERYRIYGSERKPSSTGVRPYEKAKNVLSELDARVIASGKEPPRQRYILDRYDDYFVYMDAYVDGSEHYSYIWLYEYAREQSFSLEPYGGRVDVNMGAINVHALRTPDEQHYVVLYSSDMDGENAGLPRGHLFSSDLEYIEELFIGNEHTLHRDCSLRWIDDRWLVFTTGNVVSFREYQGDACDVEEGLDDMPRTTATTCAPKHSDAQELLQELMSLGNSFPELVPTTGTNSRELTLGPKLPHVPLYHEQLARVATYWESCSQHDK